jgi:hypothetical protein
MAIEGGLSQLENRVKNCQVTWKYVSESAMETMGLTSGIRKVWKKLADPVPRKFPILYNLHQATLQYCD